MTSPIEAWKCLGEVGEIWLTRLFNKILMTKQMPDEWRKSVVVPIYIYIYIYEQGRYTKLYQLLWD